MSIHKTAALKVLFLGYTIRTSPTGEYYVFNVVDQEGSTDICKMDSIHKSKVDWLFDSLDQGNAVSAPVIRDLKSGYRIDLTAIDDFNPNKKEVKPILPPPPRPKASTKGRTRLQLNIEPWKHEFIERLAEAEGYSSYTDWLRGIIDRVIEAAQQKEGEA